MPIYRHPESPYWWVRFSVGGIKIRRSSQTTERGLAEEFEARLRANYWRQIKLGERPKYTWKDAVKRWHAESTGRDKDRDLARLTWFDQYLADVPLAGIPRSLIDKLRATRTLESSPATANRYMAGLRMILRKAAGDWDWIDQAPKIPMQAMPKGEQRFLTRPQFNRLKRALPAHLATMAEFSVETGLRMRNVTHLQWDQVDLRRRILIVPAARAKAGETIAIPLSVRAASLINAQKGKGARSGAVFRFKGEEIDDANGEAFKKAAKKAGVPWLRWHDLRHTWASWHIQAGTPPHILQELGGWKSYEMVRRYAHLSTTHLQQYAENRGGKVPKRAQLGTRGR